MWLHDANHCIVRKGLSRVELKRVHTTTGCLHGTSAIVEEKVKAVDFFVFYFWSARDDRIFIACPDCFAGNVQHFLSLPANLSGVKKVACKINKVKNCIHAKKQKWFEAKPWTHPHTWEASDVQYVHEHITASPLITKTSEKKYEKPSVLSKQVAE